MIHTNKPFPSRLLFTLVFVQRRLHWELQQDKQTPSIFIFFFLKLLFHPNIVTNFCYIHLSFLRNCGTSALLRWAFLENCFHSRVTLTMQTPKTRATTLEVPQRTQKTARQLKTSGTETDNSSSHNPVAKTPIARSPKVVDRRSPRTPTEKKRPGRVSELETQLANLQEELKKAKDQLSESESLKKRAHEEAEDAKKQLAELTEKLQDSQQQLDVISASGESRLQELIKVSQDRDRAWESELDAVKNHHSMDSAALAAAVNEIQKLMMQLEKVAESEANHAKYAESAHDEMLKLRLEVSETLAVVEEIKVQLKDSQDSEAKALENASQTRKQMETLESTEETLKLEKLEAMKSCESLTVELENTKAKAVSLEEIVSKLEMKNRKPANDNDDGQEEINCLKMEAEKLKEELKRAYELVEQTKAESIQKVLMFEDMKAKLDNVTEENKFLNKKLEKTELTNKKDVTNFKKLEAELEDLKRIKFENETELKNLAEELEKLKKENSQVNNEAAKIAEIEALMKAERVTEQLALAQAANAEMEAELRRVKVQTDQWRKAAEAAAAMISGGTNGKFVERTGSLDTHTIGGKLNSPFLEDVEDESPKKKNGNMLKKFGVFMKSKR